jgi:hypothetical protein
MNRLAAWLEDRALEVLFTDRGERRCARLRAVARVLRKASRRPAG